MDMQPLIYTIGHSTHSINYFLDLLRHFSITLVADVRSVASSRFNPQFNKKAFETSLIENDIAYQHFPDAFGARQTDENYLDETGQVDFERFRNSTQFQNGVNALRDLSKHHRIALMCAEADPLSCHRFGMIAPALTKQGWRVEHILKDKTSHTQTELEEQLIVKYARKLPVTDLFTTKNELVEMAYRLLNTKIGYKAS